MLKHLVKIGSIISDILFLLLALFSFVVVVDPET